MATKLYRGSCHCGAVRYEASVDLDHTISCNCSRCGRLGSILAFTPAENFNLISGEDTLTDYLFNKHVIHHLFCRACGIESFARGTKPDGTAMIAVNARCLEGIDPDALTPQKVDGRSL